MFSTKKIYAPRTDIFITVKNRHLFFALELQPAVVHLDFKRPLIDDLLKPVAERRVHLHGAADNPAGKVAMPQIVWTVIQNIV